MPNKRRNENQWVDCPFERKDDGKICSERLQVPSNNSPHVIQRHFDRFHKDWTKYTHQDATLIPYSRPLESDRELEKLDLQEIFLNWFIYSGIPFSNIESQEAWEIVRRCGHSPNGFSRKAFNRRLDEKTNDINKELSKFCRHSTLRNISADIWTSADQRSFLSVMLTSMNDKQQQVCRLIGFEEIYGSHNSEKIQHTLRNVLETMDISPQEVGAFVMDSAAANIKAVKELREDHGKNPDSCYGTLLTDSMVLIPCLSHVLQNALKDGFQNGSYAEELTLRVHDVMKVLKNRLSIRHILRQQQWDAAESHILERITFNSTRWHSTSMMLSRFLQLLGYIQSTVDQARGEKYITLSEFNFLTQVLRDKEDIASFSHVLEQIRKQCKILEREQVPTFSKVLRTYLIIAHEILPTEDDDSFHAFKRTVFESLTSRLRGIDTDALVTSSLLDPEFITSPSLLSHLLKTFSLGDGEDGSESDFQDEQMRLFARFCESLRRYWREQWRMSRSVPGEFTGTVDDCTIDEGLIHEEIKNQNTRPVLLKKRGRENSSEFPSFAVWAVWFAPSSATSTQPRPFKKRAARRRKGDLSRLFGNSTVIASRCCFIPEDC